MKYVSNGLGQVLGSYVIHLLLITRLVQRSRQYLPPNKERKKCAPTQERNVPTPDDISTHIPLASIYSSLCPFSGLVSVWSLSLQWAGLWHAAKSCWIWGYSPKSALIEGNFVSNSCSALLGGHPGPMVTLVGWAPLQLGVIFLGS